MPRSTTPVNNNSPLLPTSLLLSPIAGTATTSLEGRGEKESSGHVGSYLTFLNTALTLGEKMRVQEPGWDMRGQTTITPRENANEMQPRRNAETWGWFCQAYMRVRAHAHVHAQPHIPRHSIPLRVLNLDDQIIRGWVVCITSSWLNLFTDNSFRFPWISCNFLAVFQTDLG